ncbi:MAG: OmpH family outer membrane protein, partial [Gemmatimonadota bacterium]
MNRFVVGMVGVLAFVLTGAGNADAQTPRLGYINSQVIMAEAPGTSEAQVAFEQDMARYRTELERIETELDTMSASFERQQSTLSPAAREERQQAIQQKFMEYQQRQTDLEEEAQQRQAELVSPIM